MSLLNKSFILLFFLPIFLCGQSKTDFDFIKSLAQPIQKTSVYNTFKDQITNNNNELELVFASLFFMYKEFFSSQDGNKCVFHPSCSLYGILAMRNEGFIKGGVMTLDRLTRCNGLSPEKYQIDYSKKVFLDPVEW